MTNNARRCRRPFALDRTRMSGPLSEDGDNFAYRSPEVLDMPQKSNEWDPNRQAVDSIPDREEEERETADDEEDFDEDEEDFDEDAEDEGVEEE
jgi:hypothetical protein